MNEKPKIKINDTEIEFDETQNYDLSTTVETADVIEKQIRIIYNDCLTLSMLLKRRDSPDEYKQYCMQKYTDFHQKYPSLFFKIIENPSTFPMWRMEEMLALKKKIEKKEGDQESAAIFLGQKYYAEFVKDTVDKLDSTNPSKKV